MAHGVVYNAWWIKIAVEGWTVSVFIVGCKWFIPMCADDTVLLKMLITTRAASRSEGAIVFSSVCELSVCLDVCLSVNAVTPGPLG